MPKQIQRFVRLRWQRNCRGTAEPNNVFLASASAIILPTAFELKFERCQVNGKNLAPEEIFQFVMRSCKNIWTLLLLCGQTKVYRFTLL